MCIVPTSPSGVSIFPSILSEKKARICFEIEFGAFPPNLKEKQCFIGFLGVEAIS